MADNNPFSELVKHNAPDSEIVSMLEIFCGSVEVGHDEAGNAIYEYADQLQVFAYVMSLFVYCCEHDRTQAINWLLTKYAPLQVSYDGNFIFHNAYRKANWILVEKLVAHASFVPDIQILTLLVRDGRMADLKICAQSVNLPAAFMAARDKLLTAAANNNRNELISIINDLQLKC